MQKDYMGMAQGQTAPQQEDMNVPAEGLKELFSTSDEARQKMGMPTGDSKEEMKQRLLTVFEKIGLLELYSTPDKQQEFATQLNQIVEATVARDLETLKQIPLFKVYTQLIGKNLGAEQQAAPGPQAAPTDFAGMMPPGGGMNAG